MNLFCDASQITRQYGRYVDDLRRLFIFHGLSCGAAENFGTLRMKLADSNAFRTDVSALVRSIRDMEKGTISADEMLTVVALASAGEELVEGRVGAGGTGNTVNMLRIFLSGVGGWRETAELEEQGEPGRPESNGRQSNDQLHEETFASEPPALSSSLPHASNGWTRSRSLAPGTNGGSAEHASPPASDQPPIDAHLELAITEIKGVLNDIDRRIGRIEPHLADITQIVQTSPELFQRASRDTGERSGAEIGRAASQQTAAVPTGQTRVGQVNEREGRLALSTEAPAIATEAQEPEPLQQNVKQTLRAPIRPSLPVSSIPDQQAVPDPKQSFARKLAVGFALQSAQPEEAPAPSTGDSPQASELSTPVFAPTNELLPQAASADASAPEQPNSLVLAAPPPAAAVDVVSPDEPQEGLDAMSEDHSIKSPKEKAARLLGIAAVLLAGLGLIGVAVTFRSPRGFADRSAGKITSSPAPQVTGTISASAERTSPPSSRNTLPGPTSNLATPSQTTPPDPQLTASRHQREADHPGAATAKQPTLHTGVPKSREVAAPEGLTGKRSTTKPAAARIIEAPAFNQNTRAARSEVAPIPHEGSTGNPSANRPHSAPSATSPGIAASASGGTVDTVTGTRVVVPEAAMRRNLISSRPPVYPPDALKQNVVGTVVLNAFIARDGTVKRIDVVRGPDIFIKSAMSAVSWRRYKPYMVGGKPVEVETPVTVSYSPE